MTTPTGLVMYAALHGVNIPGGIWLDEAKIRAVLQRLPASMTFFRIVGRPDSILLAVNGTTTEEDARRAVSAAVGSSVIAVTDGGGAQATMAGPWVVRCVTISR